MSIWKSTVVLICILGIVSANYFENSRCSVPQYHPNGALIKESVPCSSAMEHVFTTRYLPENDIYNPTLNGIKIFKRFENHCYISTNLHLTQTKLNTYRDTQSFYHKISSDTNIDLSIAGRFTMGFTLNAKTDALTAGEKDVMGSSAEIFTYTRAVTLDENCYMNPSSGSFTDDILKDFDDLPEVIKSPWLARNWDQYDRFFRKFGTHLRTEVLLGSSYRQWNFAESSQSLTLRGLKVQACFDLLGIISLKLGVTTQACSDVTEEEYAKHSKIVTSYKLDVRGGRDATRNALQGNRLQGEERQVYIEKLLNEGRKMESPMAFKYKPIWDLFLIREKSFGRRHRIATNMKQYYTGFKDFGCTYIKIGGISARQFRYDSSGKSFECVLAAQGCHSDSGCHGHRLSYIDHPAYCYGKSCLEYTDPSFGQKAKGVSARRQQMGKHDKGVNRGCFFIPNNYPYFEKCLNNNKETVIWNFGGKKTITPKPTPLPVSSAPTTPPPFNYNWLWLLLLLPVVGCCCCCCYLITIGQKNTKIIYNVHYNYEEM
ncbi:DELTA-alicitoxin-Pse2b-like [Clytia hemisphaerica]|uniref:MACPF domain-containing protein n=1 Tax=Clytia hemisphaerica TaxID=252671 RepID=A0A7M5WRN6_9CNID|eukprot:TCONS_00033733-protein